VMTVCHCMVVPFVVMDWGPAGLPLTTPMAPRGRGLRRWRRRISEESTSATRVRGRPIVRVLGWSAATRRRREESRDDGGAVT
jgi:hypothetical protein